MFPRFLAPVVSEALSDNPVVFLNGARQTGKSTLVQGLAAGGHPARYVTFDDMTALSAAKSDPKGFLSGIRGPVILDEVQRAPELFLPLKAEVDRDRKPGRFLLTGSASALVLPELARALAGRMEILTLWPLSQGEMSGAKEGFIDALFDRDAALPPPETGGREAAWERVVLGGYPEPVGRPKPERRAAWARSYITTILERDVRDLANIEGLTQMPRLLGLLAARSASLLNFAELSRAMALPQTTLKRYVALLEATFLARRLPAWSGNLGKRLVKAPKLFLNDTGLAASLLGLDAKGLAAGSPLTGPLLEAFVAAELGKQAGWSRVKPGMFHFRTEAGAEVDIVLEDGQGRCVGIETKAGSADAGDFRGLTVLAQALGRKFIRGVVLHGGREAVPFARNMHALPLSSLWRLGAGP